MSATVLTAIIVLALGACSLLPSADSPRPPGESAWSGTLKWQSSSVPDPYNWGRSADLESGTASMHASWWAENRRGGPNVTKDWRHTLSEADMKQVNTILRSVPSPSEPPNPGACWFDVDMRSDGGESLRFSAAPGTEAYTKFKEVYALLAGPDDPQFPAHSIKC